QGRTDNSWGPWATGDHGDPVSLPKLKKAYKKGTRGISWGPLLTPGTRAVPEFPNGQSAPVRDYHIWRRRGTGPGSACHKPLSNPGPLHRCGEICGFAQRTTDSKRILFYFIL
ncbi:unnamed protein product, partial [Staurois parvus]